MAPSFVTLNPVQIYSIIFVSKLATVLSLKYIQVRSKDVEVKGRAVPLQAWTGPEGSRKLRFPDFMSTPQDGGTLLALRTGRLYPQKILLVLISVRGCPGP